MTAFSPWKNCQRCDRCDLRWGVFAPAPRKRPAILVLAAAASRASQFIQEPDPLLARVRERLSALGRVPIEEVHADVLAACGPTSTPHADEAAACAQRLHDQATLKHWQPRLVVLVGDDTLRLARNAGLYRAGSFVLDRRPFPTVTIRTIEEIGHDPTLPSTGQNALWQTAGVHRAPPDQRKRLDAREVLRSIMARCGGFAWRDVGGTWQRRNGKVPDELIDAHLNFEGWLSPFLPTGAWPYCVIDVDVHNALQKAEFESTKKKLLERFPHSVVFDSSKSRGLHVYVRLPPQTLHADAVVWLTEHLASEGLLIRKYMRPGTAGPIASHLAEVPAHSVRLPFGLGSKLHGVGSSWAVRRFERWLEAADARDFEAARKRVLQARPRAAKGRWPEKAEWVRAYVLDLEVAALGSDVAELDAADPWKSVVPKLCKPLQIIATRGCLAYGTRTTNTQQLALALTHVVEPERAKSLMRHWVEHRDHFSEDIETEPARVLRASDEIVEREYKRQRRAGVPTPTWHAIDACITNYYNANQSPLAEEEVRRAAFGIASLFFFWNKNVAFISSGYFGRSLQKKNFGGKPRRRPFKTEAAQLRDILIKMAIIRQVTPADLKRHKAATYELLSPWPPPLPDVPRRWHA